MSTFPKTKQDAELAARRTGPGALAKKETPMTSKKDEARDGLYEAIEEVGLYLLSSDEAERTEAREFVDEHLCAYAVRAVEEVLATQELRHGEKLQIAHMKGYEDGKDAAKTDTLRLLERLAKEYGWPIVIGGGAFWMAADDIRIHGVLYSHAEAEAVLLAGEEKKE